VVAGNGKALGMVVAMADYFAGRVRNVIQRHSIERHWTSLNDVLYTITVQPLFLSLLFIFIHSFPES
jgi:hypothetical protein